MNINFEPVMQALFAHLQGAATLTFSANATPGSEVLTAPSGIEGLFPGLPVFATGSADGALITAIADDGSTITLSEPMTADTETGPTQFTTGFLTASRRVQHWTQVADQPALFLRRIGVTDEGNHDSGFIITTLDCEAWIYCNAGQDPNIAPDSVLTGLEQMIRASFAPDGDYGDPLFTLGGLVYWARIEGRSDISPGDQGSQAIARIPIRVTLP
ncbi:MAG: hypothetical protein KGJ57_17425 [Sphingomonadales bacterium]|nr:hypothetical protein [Sphingomonadales bacterium]MDE2171179.1 hypothetical protein [Sphingomonadales bacterium]